MLLSLPNCLAFAVPDLLMMHMGEFKKKMRVMQPDILMIFLPSFAHNILHSHKHTDTYTEIYVGALITQDDHDTYIICINVLKIN